MSDSTRRTFLKSASVGAAAVGAATAVPFALAGPAEAESTAAAHAGPFMAWIKDAKTGEIAVLVGQTEVVHRDKKLARRLAQIAATAR